MPKKARAGSDTRGVLAYLYGPGRRDEHVDPHLVAAWDEVPDPGRDPEATLTDLALMLDAPLRALRRRPPQRHVYHVAVRNAPEDRVLSDEEWARVAREMVHAAGIAPRGDDQGCRWVAVRHADDHIHIVATLAREDGRQPNVRRDIVRMHEVARRFEVEFGLRRLTHGDGTARVWPRTGEAEKAARRGLAEPAREVLQRAVREAAAVAAGEGDFFARLEAAGLRVRQRIAPDGAVTGYAVALPGDRDGDQRPVWFSGARLAPDLSLPRVRERWAGVVRAGGEAGREVWQVAAERVRWAAAVLGAGGVEQGAGDVAALGDLVAVAAGRAPGAVRAQMRGAAREFERASRVPGARRLEGEARALYRESARALSSAAAGRGGSAAALLGFLVALAVSVEASQRWHEAREYRAQAEAAGRAGRLLREAVEVTAGVSAAQQVRAARARRGVVPAARAASRPAVGGGDPLAAVVEAVVPQRAVEVLADPGWPELRRRLAALQQAGDDPGEVLAAVAARRELGSAASAARVLAWRLDGWSRVPRDAAAVGARSVAAPGVRTPPRPAPAVRRPGVGESRAGRGRAR